MKFIAFDVETTGFDPFSEEIVELAAVRFESGMPGEKLTSLINPGRPIPAAVQRIHGISDEMVADAPPIENVLPTFADFCGSDPLVAHNAPFDYNFLCAAMERGSRRNPCGIVIDTCMLARRIFPGMVNYKLATLTRYFKFDVDTFHRAEIDAVCCGLLFNKLMQRLADLDPCADIMDAVRLSGGRELRFPQSCTDAYL